MKSSCDVIAPFLTSLINKCFESNVYPDCLKVAKVTPLFKGGDRTDVNCYRPISLLPSIGKLLENVIAEQTIEHFETHDLFSDKQYGFRKGFNTEYALLDVYEKLLNNMDRGLYSCGIFLDLAKLIMMQACKRHLYPNRADFF